MSYSNIFQCLYDQPSVGVRPFPYTIFRAFDSRDISQQPSSRPNVHDFCVIWDSDHDTRVVRAAEALFAAGLLPGVQFLGEHKGDLTIILAAKAYLDTHHLYERVINESAEYIGDYWGVEVGRYDRSGVNTDPLIHMHQCDFKELLSDDDETTLRKLWNIDFQWDLGTKPLLLRPIYKENPLPPHLRAGWIPAAPPRPEPPRAL